MQEKLDVTESEADKKEVFNIGIITRVEEPTKSLKPTQKLPQLLLERIDSIQRFQEKCYALCQVLLETFAIILGASSLSNSINPVIYLSIAIIALIQHSICNILPNRSIQNYSAPNIHSTGTPSPSSGSCITQPFSPPRMFRQTERVHIQIMVA